MEDMNTLPAFLTDPDPERIYGTNNYIVLDFETDTTGGTYGSAVVPSNGLVLACWKYGSGHRQLDIEYENGRGGMVALWGSEFDMAPLLEAISHADFIVAHNAKYELMWLARCGLDLANVVVFDTKIGEYVLLGNLASGDDYNNPRSTSLGACAVRRGLPAKDPVVDTLIGHGINPIGLPKAWLEGRCRRDVWETEAIFWDQREKLARSARLGVMLTRCLLTPVLSDVEFQGMCLDSGRVEETIKDYEAQYRVLSAEMEDMTGGINWRSPKQAADFIYDKLKFKELMNYKGKPVRTKIKYRASKVDGGDMIKSGGLRKTDKDTLNKLVATNKKQRAYLDLRKRIGSVNAALTKNLEFFNGICLEYESVFHAEFNQTRTATHRLSSSGHSHSFTMYEKPKRVQFQNMPRVFKRLFKARNEGWLMGEADGAQLEFRVAAFLGQDEQAKADIVSKHDVHKFTASELNNIEMEAVTDEERQAAKADTFKPLYGGKSGTDAQQRYYASFRERYSALSGTQDSWVQEVLNSPFKRLQTSWGMRYYWPHAKRSKSGYVNCEASVFNYPVQGLATAEIIPIAFVYFWHRVQAEGLQDKIRSVNTVHDSVVCEIHPDAVDDFKRIAKQAFTHDVYNYLSVVYGMDFNVPLGIGIKVGEHWGEGTEEKFDIERIAA